MDHHPAKLAPRKPPSPRRPAAAVQKPPSVSSLEATYVLWDELDQLPMEDNQALSHLAAALMRLLKADDVKWLAAVRVLQGNAARKDPLLGWRLRATYDYVISPEEYKKRISWWFQRSINAPTEVQMGLATKAIVAGAGKFQARRMRDGFIPFEEFRRSEHYKFFYETLGVSDRMWISFPLNSNAESMFLIDRIHNKRHFTQEDLDLAAFILRGIRWFHRRLLLSKGLLIANTILSPNACRILQKLLTGMSEKEIAASMNQSLGTTHSYVKTIYQQFGVNGRAALMSLWLRNG